MKRLKIFTLILSAGLMNSLYADSPSVVINNNAPVQQQAQPSSNQNNCNNQANNNQGPPPGTYYQTNPHGGTDTVYSTGNKQPYIVDNNCNNNSAIIQPYVYAQPPGPPAPRVAPGAGR